MLLYKLQKLGVRVVARDWFKNHLTDCNDVKFGMMKIDCEVPLLCISTGSMLEVYASKSPTYLEKLVKLNNTLLWLLQNKPLLYPVALLYNEFNTLLITDLHQQQLLLFAYKLLHLPQKIPEIFKNYFESNECVHEYNTTSSAELHLHRANTTYWPRCLKYKLLR